MRYSLVLPRAQKEDPDETREALDKARALWATGDQVQALTWVRRAAWASSKAGRESRAVALSKAAVALRHQVDPDNAPTVPPPGPRPQGARIAGRSKRSSSPNVDATVGQAAAVRRIAPQAPPMPRISGITASNGTYRLEEDFEDESAGGRHLIITLAEPGWAPDATSVIARRAVRVAIERTRAADGTIVARPLEPGEVAHRDCAVALLVPLDPPTTE